MTTLELRNLYAKKISKSLNKVLEQIDLLNNIDNNIILNNNFVGSESKIYNNNLYGGSESKFADTECNLKPFEDMHQQLQNSLATYGSIEENIQKLIYQYKAQIQAKDSDITQLKQELDARTQNTVSRDKYDTDKNAYILRIREIGAEKKELTSQVENLGDALQKCTDCKQSYLHQVNEMKTQVDSNNDAVSKLLNTVQSQLQPN